MAKENAKEKPPFLIRRFLHYRNRRPLSLFVTPPFFLSRHLPFFLFVIRRHSRLSIRRLDRRIQRKGQTTPSAEDRLTIRWIRRMNRRMTWVEGDRMDSPVTPANDDSVIGDQLPVIGNPCGA